MKTVTLKNEKLTVTVSAKGAELQNVVSAKGTEFIWCGDPAVWEQKSPLLFPICGALKNDSYELGGKTYSLPKHGFAQNAVFAVESFDDQQAVFALYADEETKKIYPYDFVLRVIYKLEGNKLIVDYAVENKGDSVMYFSAGAHEGYACPEGIENYTIVFEKPEEFLSYGLAETDEGVLVSDAAECVAPAGRELPLKKSFFAIDALIFKNISSDTVSLIRNGGNKKITLSYPGFDYFLIWTKPEGDYVCLEPWAGFPDTVGSGYDFTKKEGILSVEGNNTKTLTHTMTFED